MVTDSWAVEAAGLYLEYVTADDKIQALHDIGLQIKQGDFVSLIGPSGCGKTTLLRVIADLEQPTSGSISVAGRTPHEARLARAYGYVFQAPALLPWRTVAGNVALPHEIFDTPKRQREAAVKDHIDLVGLAGFERKFPWQLSGGMQQRVSIARALSFEPPLLLMDEPFGALDEITRNRLNLELLRIWKATGKTVIFVTHSIPEAVFLSQRVVVMSPRPGRIVDVVDVDLPSERTPAVSDTPEFISVAARVRSGLGQGHTGP